MSLARPQATYPDEVPARAAVARELEWVQAHILAGKEGEVVKVEDVQQFVMTAPGPIEKDPQARMQREYRAVSMNTGGVLTVSMACSTILSQSADSGFLRDAPDREQGGPAVHRRCRFRVLISSVKHGPVSSPSLLRCPLSAQTLTHPPCRLDPT